MNTPSAATLRRLGLGAAIGAGVVMTASGDSGPGICIVRHISGGYCPGCGGTRAAQHLVTGDIAAAWSDHPFVVLAVAQLAVATVVGVVLFATTGAGRHVPAPAGPRGSPMVGRTAVPLQLLAAVNVAALLGIWITRLALGQIPAPL